MTLKQQIFISIITIICSTFLSFIYGIKAGKSQQDRSRLQNMYKDIYLYVEDLEKSLKNWKKLYDEKEGLYCFVADHKEQSDVISRLIQNGEIIYLHKKLINDIKNIEVAIGTYRKEIAKIEISIANKIVINGNLFFRKGLAKNEIGGYDTGDYDNVHTFISSDRYMKLLVNGEIKEFIKHIKKIEGECVTICGGKSCAPINIYPHAIDSTIEEIELQMEELLKEEKTKYKSVSCELESKTRKIKKILKQVKKRAREPKKIYEIILGM